MNLKLLNILALSLLAACVNHGAQMSKADQETAAAYNLQLGVDYFRQGNLAQAKEKLDRSLQQNPRNAQTYMAAGLLYERLNEKSTADQYYGRAVELDPKNGEVLNAYAVFLCRNDNVTKGEQLALQAAANPLYKTPEAAWFNAGMCALEVNKKDLAEQYFRKALAVNAKFAAALLQMADMEFNTGNHLPARAFLERFQQSGNQTAESLWLGYRIEQALENAAEAAVYAKRLKAEFVTSAQTKLLLESEKKK